MIGRICVRNVATATADESVRVAAQRMSDRNVGMLVVIDKAGRPVGLVTDRDLALRVVVDARDPFATTVAEVMSPNPRLVHESMPIESALAHMRSAGCRRLPVVDDGGLLVGVASLDDILRLLSDEFRRIGDLLESEIPREGPGKPRPETFVGCGVDPER